MGFFGWLWSHRSDSASIAYRTGKELEAIDHLRRVIEGEEGNLLDLDLVVKNTEKFIRAGRFEDAERYVVSHLVPLMSKKAMLDSMVKGDWKKFKGSVLSALNKERAAIRKT